MYGTEYRSQHQEAHRPPSEVTRRELRLKRTTLSKYRETLLSIYLQLSLHRLYY